MQERSAVRTRPVVVVDNIMLGGGGVAEDADVDIQPITRAGFVPAKVFRSRSMNTPAGSRTSRFRIHKEQWRRMTEDRLFIPQHCR